MPEGEPMDPYQPPLQNEPLPSPDGSGLPRLTGAYYTTLGWCSFAFAIFTAIVIEHLHLNVSFLLWFWIGSSLKRKSNRGRLAAIIVFWVVLVTSLLVLNNRIDEVTFGPFSYEGNSSPAYFIQGAYLLFLGLPGIFLMTPHARKIFQGKVETK